MSKKILPYFFCFFISANIAMAATTDTSVKIQMLDSEIAKLTAEKQQKYSDLEKCQKSVKGFKIAGITTLGLTAVGAGVNIYQMSKISKQKDQISSNEENLKNLRAEQERVASEKADQAAKEECEKTITDAKTQECIKDNQTGKWVIKNKIVNSEIIKNTLNDDQNKEYNSIIAIADSAIKSDACAKEKLPECKELQKLLDVVKNNVKNNVWDEKSIESVKNQVNVLFNAYENKTNPEVKLTNAQIQGFDAEMNKAMALLTNDFCRNAIVNSDLPSEKARTSACVELSSAYYDVPNYKTQKVRINKVKAYLEKLKEKYNIAIEAQKEYNKTVIVEIVQNPECKGENLSEGKKFLCEYIKNKPDYSNAHIECNISGAVEICQARLQNKYMKCTVISGTETKNCEEMNIISAEEAAKTFKFNEGYNFSIGGKFIDSKFSKAFNKKLFEQICVGNTGRLDRINKSVYCTNGLRSGISTDDSKKFYYTADCAGNCATGGKVFADYNLETEVCNCK